MEKKRIATLFLIVFADMAGASAILPIIPLYVVGQFRATPLQAALVLTVYYVAQMLASPLLGNLSDRLGRRPVLLISQAGTIVSYLLIVFAAPLGALLDQAGLQIGVAGGPVVIYLARLLDGVTGGNISVAQAYASDVSTPEERTRALGLIGGASGIGHILGPALAGLLSPLGLLTPFMGAAVISGITLLLTLLWLHEPQKHAESLKQGRVPLSQAIQRVWNLPILLLLAMVLVVGLYMAALFGTAALYTGRVLLPHQPETVVVPAVGAIVTVIGLIMALVQIFLLKPVAGHLGERRALLPGCVLLLISAAGFSAFTSLWWFIAFMVVFSFGVGIISPTLQSLLTRQGPESIAGRMLGWYQSMFSLSLILGPVWSGWVFEAVAPQAVFMVSAGLMVLALVLSLIMQRLLRVQSFHHHHEPAGVHFHH
ncbi:MAG: MFS transporter [Ktedonobacteraceae bacterium]|nr:MFS transporter [Ktedonobacteraceae bacterium]